MTTAAADTFRDLGATITTELRAARGTAHTALLARIGENAQKLALIAAVSRDPVAPQVQAPDAHWAISFVRHFADKTMHAVERHVADNEIERTHKKVLDIIRRADVNGLTKSELTRKTQFLERRTRDEALVTLTEAGLIVSRMRPSATRPTAVFVVAEDAAG